MNYFSFWNITIGILVFSSVGIAVAFIAESLGLLSISGGTLVRLGKHLYKHRSKLFSKDVIFKECLCGKQQKNSAILDFIMVLLLFSGYMLVAYVVFEGVFRLIYLIPLLFGYFFTLRFFVPLYHRMYLLLMKNALVAVSLFLSAPIFLLDKFFLVLKLPILSIIHVSYGVLLCMVSPTLSRRWKRKLCLEVEETLGNFKLNI